MIGKTFAVRDNDLQFGPKSYVWVENQGKIAQDMEILLKTVYGEDKFDPYYGSDLIGIETFDEDLVEQEIKHTLNQHNYFKEIENIEVSYDNENRKVTVNVKVKLTDNTRIELGILA